MEGTRNEIRAQIFLEGADEIAKIDDTTGYKPVLGRIAVCGDAIRKAIGGRPADLERQDARTIELLQTAAAEGFGLRIRNTIHLFEVLNKHVERMSVSKVCKVSKAERQKGEKLLRRIHAKLTNGYAGCDI